MKYVGAWFNNFNRVGVTLQLLSAYMFLSCRPGNVRFLYIAGMLVYTLYGYSFCGVNNVKAPCYVVENNAKYP